VSDFTPNEIVASCFAIPFPPLCHGRSVPFSSDNG
jgi:hypothetical protein